MLATRNRFKAGWLFYVVKFNFYILLLLHHFVFFSAIEILALQSRLESMKILLRRVPCAPIIYDLIIKTLDRVAAAGIQLKSLCWFMKMTTQVYAIRSPFFRVWVASHLSCFLAMNGIQKMFFLIIIKYIYIYIQ